MTAADWEPELEDIAAMRAENDGADLKAFMRAQIAAGRSRRQPAAKPKPPAPPGHRPGAWPTGSSPPGPAPERSLPPEVWADAVRRYRIEQRHQLDQEDQ